MPEIFFGLRLFRTRPKLFFCPASGALLAPDSAVIRSHTFSMLPHSALPGLRPASRIRAKKAWRENSWQKKAWGRTPGKKAWGKAAAGPWYSGAGYGNSPRLSYLSYLSYRSYFRFAFLSAVRYRHRWGKRAFAAPLARMRLTARALGG